MCITFFADTYKINFENLVSGVVVLFYFSSQKVFFTLLSFLARQYSVHKNCATMYVIKVKKCN